MNQDIVSQLLNGCPEAVLLIERNGRLRGWNTRAPSVFGWKDVQDGKTTIENLVAKADRPRVLKAIDLISSSASSSAPVGRLEARALKRDGTEFPAEFRIVPLRSDAQALFGVYVRNLSDSKVYESSQRQARKMEALGRLAGGVSHDFNNLLTVILGYSSLLERGLEENHPMREYVEEITKSGNRAAKLTRQLLAFSRKQMLSPKVLDLNTVVRDMENMLRRVVGEHITFETSLGTGIGTIRADPGQIEQVIMNLVVNARDAMSQGGVLGIHTKEVSIDAEESARHSDAQVASYVLLAISDTGRGIDAETRTHLFEPFFTTKGKDRGTGLGLSTVYGIVKQSGGFIRVKSEPDQGTVFEVLLPVAGAPADEGSSSSLSASRIVAGGTVLIAEDSDTVRSLAAHILTAKGFKVLQAANGEDALKQSREHTGTIHLLVSDVVMPGMNGPELADRLRSQRPKVKILYMSGYPGDNFGGMEGLGPDPAFLQKPFTPKALTSKVYEVLDSKPAPGPAVL